MLILCTFCAAQNRSFKLKFSLKRSLNSVVFAKKAKIFCIFFLRPRLELQILTLCPWPPSPFENFSLDALNSEQKPSVKNGRPDRSETGRRAENRRRFWNYRLGRIEKILTGSISGTKVLSDEVAALKLIIPSFELSHIHSWVTVLFQSQENATKSNQHNYTVAAYGKINFSI